MSHSIPEMVEGSRFEWSFLRVLLLMSLLSLKSINYCRWIKTTWIDSNLCNYTFTLIWRQRNHRFTNKLKTICEVWDLNLSRTLNYRRISRGIIKWNLESKGSAHYHLVKSNWTKDSSLFIFARTKYAGQCHLPRITLKWLPLIELWYVVCRNCTRTNHIERIPKLASNGEPKANCKTL